MNILSLFDGMSCGRIALNLAGIPVDRYYASEIDAHAMKVAQANYPDTIQIGDVRKVRGADFSEIGLLMGGSPCQGFSFAGSGLNFDDERSRLFFEFDRIRREVNPKYFLLENVRMKKEWEDVITGYMGVSPIRINSSLFSAQNRERLYWTNIPVHFPIEDRGVLIRDIIDEKWDSDSPSGGIVVLRNIYPKKGQNGNVYSINGKCKTLSAGVGIKGNGIGSSNAPKIEDQGEKGWRRLSPVECERLQTVPDGYAASVCDTQRYKMLGNGWTVEVIAYILKHMVC